MQSNPYECPVCLGHVDTCPPSCAEELRRLRRAQVRSVSEVPESNLARACRLGAGRLRGAEIEESIRDLNGAAAVLRRYCKESTDVQR